MDAQVAVSKGLSQIQPNHVVLEFLRQLTSRELMDVLMAADMPMGGTNEQRIERLLSVMQPQDLAEFLPPVVVQRASATVGLFVE